MAEQKPEEAVERQAKALIKSIDALDEDRLASVISDEAVQALLTAAVKAYASKLEAEEPLFPFTSDEALTATEVGMTVGNMIKAADIDLFELVSWQSLRGH